MSSSPITIEHYERPEVRDIILRQCKYGGGLRALNGDNGWYVHQDKKVRLRGPDDFDDTISRARTLYITADVFDPAVFETSVPWEEGRGGEGKPVVSIGKRGDLIAYTLIADIDATKDEADKGDKEGKPRSKIYHEGRIEGLEAAATFMVRYLKERGITDSMMVAFSGQGIYVWLHPGLSDMSEVRALPDFDRDQLDETFKIYLMAFNDLLADIEKAFFQEFPEHKGRVKFDKLNNIKRKIKCMLSIHKTLPFAVVPLDRDDIKIDLEAARIGDHGLPAETVEGAKVWLSTWKAGEGERSALVKLLEPYRQRAAEDVTAKAKTSGDIWRSFEPIPVESWCPFYRALLEFPGGAGAHRVCGGLATWLYQAGWPEEEALQLWGPVAARCGVESRIFFTSYGVINSPSCETIQKQGAGYPVLSFGELGLCVPNDQCTGCKWPGDYGADPDGAEARDFLETMMEALTENPRKLKDRDVLAALLTLREKDHLEFDILANDLKESGGVKLRTLKKMIDDEAETQKKANRTVGGTAFVANYPNTEGGNASRLKELHGENVRYCPQMNSWFIWDGNRWAIDRVGRIFALARDVVTHLYSKGPPEEGEPDWAKISDSRRGFDNMVMLASRDMDLVVDASEWDADPMKMTFIGGTFDFRNNVYYLPKREDLISLLGGCEMVEGAVGKRWNQFVEEVWPNEEIRNWVQRCVGYGISGDMSQKCFFYGDDATGDGDNGKSVFQISIRTMCGEYGIHANMETFLRKKHGTDIRDDLVNLRGKRFITAGEPGENAVLNMEVLKPWTGRDPIRARSLYQKEIQFTPQGTIWLAGNNRPLITETTAAAWDRVKVIPFHVSFKGRQDRTLGDKLDSERSAILWWCIEGYAMYLKDGLTPPEEVLKAHEEYKKSCNSLETFINVDYKVIVCPGQRVRTVEFHKAYKEYCEESNLHPLKPRKIRPLLCEIPGVTVVRRSDGEYYEGICLYATADEEVREWHFEQLPDSVKDASGDKGWSCS